MVYELRAVVAVAPAAGRLAETSGGLLVELPSALAMVPVTERVLAGFGSARAPESVFGDLTVGLEELSVAASTAGPLGYFEAEMFGGVGSQAVAVWDRGRLVVGPMHHDDEVEPDLPLARWPFNTALRRLGVRSSGTTDEFDMVGLGRFRATDDWVSSRL